MATFGHPHACYCATLVAGMLLSAPAVAEDAPRFELDTLVITGSNPTDSWSMTRNASVITAEDIANATSNNLTDLLAREAGVNLRSFFGNDKNATLDLRGMGETSNSNVIIMLDGIRINAPDLSGADLSSIALSDIKRIEILRGGGAVRYGDGAIGGVINIQTVDKRAHHRLNIRGRYGSFDSDHTAIQAGYSDDPLQLDLHLQRNATEGHRINSQLESHDAKFAAQLTPSPRLTLDGSVRFHFDNYGLPGPVSKTDFHTAEGRHGSNAPFDHGKTREQFWRGGFSYDAGRWGNIQFKSQIRDRKNDFVIGFSPIADTRGQNDEDTLELEATYLKQFDFTHTRINLTLGASFTDTDYVSRRNGFAVEDQSERKFIDLQRHAWFAETLFTLFEDVSLSMGYRFDHSALTIQSQKFSPASCDTVFIPGIGFININCEYDWQTTATATPTWDNHAIEIGANVRLTDFISVYGNFSQSFRSPNVDELAEASTDLSPQTSRQFEVGLRTRWSQYAEMSAAFYQLRSHNEIRYSGTLNVNIGEPTVRHGMELEARFYPHSEWYVWTNYTLLDAQFAGSGNAIPLVAKHAISGGVEWSPGQDFMLAVSGSFVGQRFDGNDLDNRTYDTLDSYWVLDLKARYQFNQLEVFAGINNIFDDVYSTTAFSETYYPMPERHAYAGFDLQLF